MHLSMHSWLTSQLKHADVAGPGSVFPYRQSVWYWQPSSSCPELPSKKQSWQRSMLSPGMPVANEPSSLSCGPLHSGSAASTKPSLSSSTQFVQAVVPQAPEPPMPLPPVPDVEPPLAVEPPIATPPALPP